MGRYPNKIVRNRHSPSNEQSYINAYKQMNPRARKTDNLDIAVVRLKDGTAGHALLTETANRSKDKSNHIGQDFISDKDLRKHMKK